MSNPEPVASASEKPAALTGDTPSESVEPTVLAPPVNLAEHSALIARAVSNVEQRVSGAVDFVVVHLRDLSSLSTQLSRGLEQLTANNKSVTPEQLIVDTQQLFEFIDEVPCDSIQNLVCVKANIDEIKDRIGQIIERHDEIPLDEE